MPSKKRESLVAAGAVSGDTWSGPGRDDRSGSCAGACPGTVVIGTGWVWPGNTMPGRPGGAPDGNPTPAGGKPFGTPAGSTGEAIGTTGAAAGIIGGPAAAARA